LKRFSFVITFVIVALFVLAGTAYAKASKVDVCHVTVSESNPAVLVSVSENSLESHVNHRDYLSENGSCDLGGPGDPPGES